MTTLALARRAPGAARPAARRAPRRHRPRRLAQEAVALAAQDAAGALSKARRALALTAEFVPTEYVDAGRKGEVVEDEFKAARDEYKRHRATLYEARRQRPGATRAGAPGEPLPAPGVRCSSRRPRAAWRSRARSTSSAAGARRSHTVQRAIAGLTGLLPEAAEVIVRAADVAGLPSAQAEIDRGRLAAILGAEIKLREGPLELPPGVRLSTNPVFRLDEAEINVIYAAEASCRSCSADLEELARAVPKSVRVLTLPPGDDQDKALRQVLDLYRRPWPLLLGRTLATRPGAAAALAADRGARRVDAGGAQRALRQRARHGARGGAAKGRAGERAARQLEPASGRPHAAAQAPGAAAGGSRAGRGRAVAGRVHGRGSGLPRRPGRRGAEGSSTPSRRAATAGCCRRRRASTAPCASPARGSATRRAGSCCARATAASRTRSTSCWRRSRRRGSRVESRAEG